MVAQLEQLPPLDIDCKACGGKGHVRLIKCGECNGIGKILTRDGEVLAGFILRHIRADLAETDSH